MIATMEKEYTQLQERFRTAQEECASLQREAGAAKREAADLQERLQNTELQVVSLKLEIEAKQGELDGLHGKVSRLEQRAMAAKTDQDDDLSKAWYIFLRASLAHTCVRNQIVHTCHRARRTQTGMRHENIARRVLGTLLLPRFSICSLSLSPSLPPLLALPDSPSFV